MKKSAILSFLFSLLIFFASCKKDDDNQIDNNENTYPLILQVTPDFIQSIATIEWEASTQVGFVKYQLLSSPDSIPDLADPSDFEFNDDNNRYSFFNSSIDSFIDERFPIINDRYYKLYLELEDRFLYSATVKATGIRRGIKEPLSRAFLTPNGNLLLYTNWRSTYLYNLNSETSEKTNSLYWKYRYGDTGNGEKLYAISEFYKEIHTINPEDATILDTIPADIFYYPERYNFDIETSKHGFLFTINRNGQFKCIKENDSSVVFTDDISSSLSPVGNSLAKITNNKVIAFSYPDAFIFTINNDGTLANKESFTSNNDYHFNQYVSRSLNGSHFLPSQELTVLDTNLNIINSSDLIATSNTYSHDGQYIYAGSIGKITKLSAADLSIVNTINLPDAFLVNQIIDTEEKLIILSRFENNTIIQSIPN